MEKNEMIEIIKINNIIFKKNKKSSNFYIKEDDGKFVRVKSAEYKARIKKENDAVALIQAKGAEHNAQNKVNFAKKIINVLPSNNTLCKFVIVDLFDEIQLPAIEISCGKKTYNKAHVCLADAIARKHGVQLILNRKKINGNRVYKFIGEMDAARDAIEEFNDNKKISNIMHKINTLIFFQQNIDDITKICLKARKTMLLDFGY